MKGSCLLKINLQRENYTKEKFFEALVPSTCAFIYFPLFYTVSSSNLLFLWGNIVGVKWKIFIFIVS